MSKFIHNIAQWKFMISLYFMASMIISSIVLFFLGMRSFDFLTIWQILITCMVAGATHYIYFTHWSNPVKISVHVVVLYALILIASQLFGWWKLVSMNVFFKYTGIFLLAYSLISIGFWVYYNNEEKVLNKNLNEFKSKEL